MTNVVTRPPRKATTGRTNLLRPVTRQVVWARACGRCHICNVDLIGDLLTSNEDAAFGFVAHIVADAPRGPRGDPVRSPVLADDPANLMLLCHVHHKLIDVDEVDEYPEDRLLAIKERHERRVALLTELLPGRATHVIRYAANVGVHRQVMPYQDVARALLPERYPADGPRMIDLSLRGSSLEDDEEAYWATEAANLRRQFATKVHERIEAGEMHHLSVFAIAPQPLLVLLGTLLGDLSSADVFQRHREPPSWEWPKDGPSMPIDVSEPEGGEGPVALKFAFSAAVDDVRIRAVLGDDARVWSITTPAPHNDVLKRPADLAAYRVEFRRLLDRIKARHGQNAVLNLFPAMPVALAVETGRVWMPKADVRMRIFDQNWKLGGFRMAIEP